MSAFAKVKEREAAERMRMLRRAAIGRRAAVLEQRRASLVGRLKSRITNMDQVLAVMAKWA